MTGSKINSATRKARRTVGLLLEQYSSCLWQIALHKPGCRSRVYIKSCGYWNRHLVIGCAPRWNLIENPIEAGAKKFICCLVVECDDNSCARDRPTGIVDNLARENALKLIKSVVFSGRIKYDCIVVFRPGPTMVDLN